MQISSIVGGSAAAELQRLLSLMQSKQTSSARQDLPDAISGDQPSGPPPGPPPGAASSSRFAGDTLSALLGVQQSPPSSSDIASRLVSQADTDGDGSLSLAEVTSAIGGDSSTSQSSSTSTSDAFAKLDSNGDGQLGADELKAAIDAFKQAMDAAWSSTATTSTAASTGSSSAALTA